MEDNKGINKGINKMKENNAIRLKSKDAFDAYANALSVLTSARAEVERAEDVLVTSLMAATVASKAFRDAHTYLYDNIISATDGVPRIDSSIEFYE